jgi:hypothetical protein
VPRQADDAGGRNQDSEGGRLDRKRAFLGTPVASLLLIFRSMVEQFFFGRPLAFGISLISSPMRWFAASTTISALFLTSAT